MFLSFSPRHHHPAAVRDPWFGHRYQHPCSRRSYPHPRPQYETLDLDDLLATPLQFIAALANEVQQNQNQTGGCKRKDSVSADANAKKARFEVKMNVHGYAPSELDVKLVDNCLVIKGSHESTDEQGGSVSRQFTRKFQIPEDVQMEDMTCNLNSKDHTILISAPRKQPALEQKEKVIPITLAKEPEVDKAEAAVTTTEEQTTPTASEKNKETEIETENEEKASQEVKVTAA